MEIERRVKNEDSESSLDNDNFNWYSYEIDIENSEIKLLAIEDKQGRIFGLILTVIYYILGLEILILLFIHTFKIGLVGILGFKNTLILDLIFISGICALGMHVLFLSLRYVATHFQVKDRFRENNGIVKLFLMMVWFFSLRMIRSNMKYENHHFYHLLKHLSTCGIITTVVLIFSDFILRRFQSYFIRESLKYKIKETQKTEKILGEMVKYRMDAFSSSSASTIIHNECAGLFWNHFYDDNIKKDDVISAGFSDLMIDRPVLQNVEVAIDLAKSVYYKVAKDKSTLEFIDFCTIFRHKRFAVQAFAYFDSNQDRVITKKEFRDTILEFYRQRSTLAYSINATKGFTDIINQIWYFMAFFFLLIVYLVIFGIPLAKIATVLISTALAFNVVIGSLCANLVKNFAMLISHQYDIGDDVVIDGEDLKVHEIGLSTTSFVNVQGGKLKIENVDLWKKTVVNMTKAPEKNITFTFKLPADITLDKIKTLQTHIHDFLHIKVYDFLDNFEMINQKSVYTDINFINCTLVLKCKGYKNKSKKFILRVEFTHYLREILKKLNIFTTIE